MGLQAPQYPARSEAPVPHKNRRGQSSLLTGQGFGSTPDGFPDYYRKFGYKGHNGIDFYGAKNDRIHAVCDGHVSIAHFDNTGYVNLTVIIDSDGGQHYYGHQNSILVRSDDYVTGGQLIGFMGNTGNVIGGPYSDGTHLHYGYRPFDYDMNNGYGGFVDPMPFFERKAQVESQPGWAEIVCDGGANVRDAPAGRFMTWFPKSIRIRKTCLCQTVSSLVWEKIDGGYWIARTDSYGTVMLKDVE